MLLLVLVSNRAQCSARPLAVPLGIWHPFWLEFADCSASFFIAALRDGIRLGGSPTSWFYSRHWYLSPGRAAEDFEALVPFEIGVAQQIRMLLNLGGVVNIRLTVLEAKACGI